MRAKAVGVLTILAGAVLASAGPAAGQPPKDPDLAKRVEQLERRVTELELLVKQTPPKFEPGAAVTARLIGSWEVADDDRDKCPLQNLVLKAGGECEYVVKGKADLFKGRYRVVGKSFLFTTPASVVEDMQFRLISVGDKELLMERVFDKDMKPVPYKWIRE